MNTTKNFELDTPISCDYGSNKGKLLGYARIYGIGSYDMQRNDGVFDKDYALMTILNVRLTINGKTQDSTFAYQIDKGLGGYLSDTIDKAAFAHLEHLFTAPDTSTPHSSGCYQVVAVFEPNQLMNKNEAA